MPAMAVVLGLQATGEPINMQPVAFVQLRISLPNQQPYDTPIKSILSPVSMPRVGDTVHVKVNPQNPHEAVILGIVPPAIPGGYPQQPGYPPRY
jgi:hypothetical protein